MRFANENTFFKAGTRKNEDLVHSRYERALEDLGGSMGKVYLNYIGKGWRKSRGGISEDRFPGDLSVINCRFQQSTREDVRNAIKVAGKSFDIWRRTDYEDRCTIFEEAATILSKRKYELAAIVTLENGKNRYEAMADIDEAIDFLRYYPYQMRMNKGFSKDTPPPCPNERPRNFLRPFGVWGVVSPFNFPAAIMMGMSTGAMITGNTIVLKPSSDAPWPAFYFAQILSEAGLPAGVLNIVTGSGSIVGDELVRNPSVSGFVFTGSREVGMGAMKVFLNEVPKPFIAEMGGKNAVIVTQNADIDEAAEGVGKAAFGYGGQKCSACSRVLVEKSIASDFVKKLKTWTEDIVVGDPRDSETFLGPLINEAAYVRFGRSVKSARDSGKIVFGGRRLRSRKLNGYYVEPTIVTGLRENHPLMIRELFMPFVCVLQVKSLRRAIEIANSSEYGLTSGIMSRDDDEVEYYMDHIEAGTIYANRRSGASTAAMVMSQPFVGWKMSGTTGKAAGGEHYLQQFMREQSQTRCV